MFTVPAMVTNLLAIAAAVISAFQHARMRRRNPVTNIQFATMALCPPVLLLVALYNRSSPWLSDLFLLIAVAMLLSAIRQRRMVPPRQRNE